MTGYPWDAGQQLNANDLNAAFSSAYAHAQWGAGVVSALSAGLTIVSGTLTVTFPAQNWTAGTVSALGTGLSLSTGTLSATAVSLTPSAFAALDLSTLPTANPGGGKPWLNGGVLQVGA